MGMPQLSQLDVVVMGVSSVRSFDGQRAGQRQVLEYRPRGARQLAPRPVTTMKRQVDGTEKLREPLCPRLFLIHGNSFPAR
jgi:hypothetical protein